MEDRSEPSSERAQAERLAAVGMLAAGVAHEINNALAYVTGNLAFARETLVALSAILRAAALDDATSLVEQIDDALADAATGSDRVQRIVRDLRVAARPPDDDTRAPFDVHQPLELAIRLAFNQIRHRARLVRTYEQVPFVEGNEARLGQVFLNLLINAAQAIPERESGHEIAVATKTDAEGHIVVEVRDTGVGIPPEHIARIFEPYFTTKPKGIGTGLGLSICRELVAAHGGSIDVETTVGRGSTFRVVLPAATKAPDAATKPRASTYPAGRRANILVVDDDPMVGRAIRRALTPDHEVMVVTAARDAVAALSSGATFDVVLCDLMMPQMSGAELHAHVLASSRAQADRFVFMSGGAFSDEARAYVESSGRTRIEKPFDPRALRSLVEQMLRGGSKK